MGFLTLELVEESHRGVNVYTNTNRTMEKYLDYRGILINEMS